MKIVSILKYDLDGNEVAIRYNANEVGDTSVGETYLEVTGLPEDAQIDAVGYMLQDSDGIPMKFADIAGLDTTENITKDGIYMIMSGALERLVISCSATCHLVIKQVA